MRPQPRGLGAAMGELSLVVVVVGWFGRVRKLK